MIISKKEYDQLIKDQNFLSALYAAGVDLWEGYEIAQEEGDGESYEDIYG